MRVLVTGGSGFIGTAVISMLSQRDLPAANIDVAPPKLREHLPYWRRCDVLDGGSVASTFRDWRPTCVIHLAARADTESNRLGDYRVNIEGTRNVVDAVAACPTVRRLVHTSTQFVLRPGRPYEDDTTFDPHTVYGESKVISEHIVRNASLRCSWVIARPTNVWGPWHPRYPQEFWRVLARGLYFHPRGSNPIRTYGYVANVADQLIKLVEMPDDLLSGRVFYLGDRPVPLLRWVNGFSRELTGGDARLLPLPFFTVLAKSGDLMARFGIRPLLTSSRLQSMTEDYITPTSHTIHLLGEPPYSLSEGIAETVGWLRSKGYPP